MSKAPGEEDSELNLFIVEDTKLNTKTRFVETNKSIPLIFEKDSCSVIQTKISGSYCKWTSNVEISGAVASIESKQQLLWEDVALYQSIVFNESEIKNSLAEIERLEAKKSDLEKQIAEKEMEIFAASQMPPSTEMSLPESGITLPENEVVLPESELSQLPNPEVVKLTSELKDLQNQHSITIDMLASLNKLVEQNALALADAEKALTEAKDRLKAGCVATANGRESAEWIVEQLVSQK